MVLGYVFPVWSGESARKLDQPPMDPWAAAGVVAAFLIFVVVVATLMERAHARPAKRTR